MTDPTNSIGANQPLVAGTFIGPYEIVGYIARGGMGLVYRARHRTLHEDVALKLLYPHLTGNTEFTTRFQREGQAMAKLRHPHIAQVLNADVIDGHHFLAMEFASRGTLQQLIANAKQLPVDQALLIARQMAQALAFAHSKRIVHRDVKPSNILWVEENRFVLTDFGIAQSGVGTGTLTGVGSIGTPEYMSPEQGQGLTVDGRSDVYSLGIVMYEMLAGKVPFSSDNPIATVYKHTRENAITIHKLRTDISPAVRDIVHKAIAKKPQDRFQSAAEMADAIGRIAPTHTPARVPTSAPRRSAPVAMLGLGGVIVASLAAAGVILTNGGTGTLLSPKSTPTTTAPATAGNAVRATSTLAPTVTAAAALPTETATATETATPTATATATATDTATPSVTPTDTSTPTPTATETATATVMEATTTTTPTPIPSNTATAIPSSTSAATTAPTATSTPIPSPTATSAPSRTPFAILATTATPTLTSTPSRTPTATPSTTATPTPTLTSTPSRTPTATRIATRRPVIRATARPRRTATRPPIVVIQPTAAQVQPTAPPSYDPQPQPPSQPQPQPPPPPPAEPPPPTAAPNNPQPTPAP